MHTTDTRTSMGFVVLDDEVYEAIHTLYPTGADCVKLYVVSEEDRGKLHCELSYRGVNHDPPAGFIYINPEVGLDLLEACAGQLPGFRIITITRGFYVARLTFDVVD